MSDLLANTAGRAQRYLDQAEERNVSPRREAIRALDALRTSFPDEPLDAGEVLAILDELGSPATVVNVAGRYFGFVNGGALPASLSASWLVSAWDQNAALQVLSPAAAIFEEIAVRWVCEAVGLPATCGGGVVTGATMANFTGLAAARHHLLDRAGWDVGAKGLFGAPELRVVVGNEVHAALLKALAMLGLGRERVIRVPADEQGRMIASALPALDERTIVCIQAGNVNTGAFDPAGSICEAARKAGAWVHVDGAFGLWAGASARYRHLTAGYELADSWATDAHKWPNTNYDCGIALVRNPEILRAAISISAAYLVTGSEREPSHYTPDSSRRARGVELWAALRSLGRTGLADLIDRTCEHAKRFAEGLSAAGFEVLNDVVINQVLVSFGTAERTREVIRLIQEDGTCWCGGTVWQGTTAMRISVSSWATTERDVERSLAAIVRLAGR